MITTIDIPIYNASVAILVEITEQQFEEFYQDNNDIFTKEEYENLKKDMFIKKYPGITLHTDSNHFLIYLKNGKSDNFVAHEIFHVCNKILLDRSVSFDEDAEAWAYLIGWFTEEYYRKYWDYEDNKEKPTNKYKLIEQLAILKEIDQDYRGKTTDNVIQQIEARLSEIIK